MTGLGERNDLGLKSYSRSIGTKASAFPEVLAGGFTSVDGTVEFYSRINSLLEPRLRVLDFGAGRGTWAEDSVNFRRDLRKLQGKVSWVVGCDVDPAVYENPMVDEAILIEPGCRLPFEDGSFGLVLADYVLEHIDDPSFLATEVARILSTGGWFCARTPNKYGYVSLAARLIRSAHHARVLRYVQPDRRPEDVFPTVYRMNTLHAIREQFRREVFDDHTYRYEAEPSYYFNSKTVFKLLSAAHRLSPKIFWSSLFVFMRKR